jgi:ribonucleoside-diphosphate reductase alpha chain|tara:strand:- start:313 stop:2076 length:1764 start_codon:yes stop_codon:yes gene_type:complete
MLKIDYSKDSLLTEFSKQTLKDRYMVGDEKSPQEAFARAAEAFADDEDHAQRIYDYASNLWFMFATPVLSNGGTKRGLPISCFLNYIEDSREGITGHYTENAYLSSMGGGIGGGWSDVRSQGTKTSKGSESTGVLPFMKVVDSEMLAFSQGVTRRGSYAAYLHMSHPEIEEFLDVRKPTGGDTNRKCTNLHHGVVIPDRFMEIIHRATKEQNFDDSWELVDPHSGEVKKIVSARTLWVKLLQNRMETGEPYLMFEDAVQSDLPEFQKKKGLKVNHSNLCSEITLATNEERTAVCCLSSVNLEYYDEWKNHPAFIPDLIRFLDNVLTYFIENAPNELERAKYSASRERSIGMGAMGFHAYLQKNSIPFEGMVANGVNMQIFNKIKSEAMIETKRMAVERGACPDDDTCSVRNAHLLAIAPNASSSIICGNTSPSIEPYRANAFTQKTKSGSYLMKNKFLEAVLETYGINDDKTWSSIIANKGSCQHLSMLSEEEREVFKTAVEINQAWIVEHASARQEYICQAQSVNLFFPPDVSKGDLHNVHMLAWAKNMKTLYYLRSEAIGRADNVSNQVKREVIFEQSDCLSCEG